MKKYIVLITLILTTLYVTACSVSKSLEKDSNISTFINNINDRIFNDTDYETDNSVISYSIKEHEDYTSKLYIHYVRDNQDLWLEYIDGKLNTMKRFKERFFSKDLKEILSIDSTGDKINITGDIFNMLKILNGKNDDENLDQNFLKKYLTSKL